MYNETFLLRAIELSSHALTEPGTQPFGAVVVKDGVIVGEGFNHAAAHHDPTSHGEVEAIRDACRRLKTLDLSGCELYSSCEPCAMCVSVLTISGIKTLYYAANLSESGAATKGIPAARRRPLDVLALRDTASKPAVPAAVEASRHHAPQAVSIIAKWAASQS